MNMEHIYVFGAHVINTIYIGIIKVTHTACIVELYRFITYNRMSQILLV